MRLESEVAKVVSESVVTSGGNECVLVVKGMLLVI